MGLLPLISGASKGKENATHVFGKLPFLKSKMVKHGGEANDKEETKSKTGVIKDTSQVWTLVKRKKKAMVKHADEDIEHGLMEETVTVRECSIFHKLELGKNFEW